MELQNFEKKRKALTGSFRTLLKTKPALRKQSIKLSWSNWGFGIEPLETTARRLNRYGVEWIELHGNRYGSDLGYRTRETLKTLKRFNLRVAGVCGMFGPSNDLSSNSGIIRQNAIDYIRRQLDLCHDTGGTYLLVVPGAVGRPTACDSSEFERSVETLRLVADEFIKARVRGAVEPIRSAEVSFVHTFEDARRYIQAVNHPGIRHINGDVYHMQVEESNIADTLFQAGDRVINLHLADSNRCALGDGSLDIDAIIMALYCTGYTQGNRFATPEPLGPGGDPYPAMFGKPSAALLDQLVATSVKYWRARETAVKQC
ncbi:MAG: sugar phosphate isomerase [Lentisphaerae bacterium RIFOXYC12_FULL_60_16]|nr:MAG: sugar phosphate isomerase [Lentisphaerae bacterium RIFOXYC12_FULL_60_16]